MRTLVLALIVTLAACDAHTPRVNQAVYHAGTLTKAKPACIPMPGVPDSPDAAVCSVGGKVMLWCWSGAGVGSDCIVLVAPKREEPQPGPQQGPQPGPAPQPSPTATPSPQTSPTPTPPAAPSSPPATPPAPGEAKGDTKKPDTKSGAKK